MASELYEQLVITYTSTDNVLRNRTEQMLVQSLIDNIQNFQFIAKLAEKQDKMQEQASSLLNQVILKMIVNNQAQLSVQHALSLIQIIISQTTPLKCKQSLIKAMSLMVKKDKQLRTEIENQMREYLKKEQYWQILSGIVFFKILIDSLEFQTYSVVQNSGYEWINEFFNSTSVFMTKLSDQTQELNDEFIITIKYYTQVVNDLCEKVFKQNVMSREQVQPIQNLLFSLNSFSGTLMILLQYSPQKGNQLPNSIILNSGIQQFDNQLNEIKSNILKSFTLLLSVLLNSRNKSDVKKGAFGPYINALCQLLLYAILAYTNNENINVILNKPFQKEIMTYLMKLLACLGTQTELYQLFSDAKVALITDVIYPFLITTKEEYQQMKEEPEEFVNLALDTVDKQESDIPKTAAAQLLETLCDHIDGSTTFLANLAIIIAQYSINEISTNPQPFKEQQQLLVQALIDKKLFKMYSSIDRIESSLLILTIMSYLIQKRGDIINAMEQLLLDNINFFQNIQESILKVRLSLFFGYFCDNLFKREIQSQNMIAYLQILISFVQPNEPVVLYQSIDSLKDVFEDDDLKQKVKNLVITLFPQLCSGLQFSTYERHFEMITNLLKRFSQQFLQNENLFIGMAQVLVQRIIFEQQQINNGVQQRHIHLNRCWNIIRTIPDENDLAPLLKLLEEQLVPLYQMLASQDKIDFDEDLILFISNCISKLSSVTSYQIQVLPYFAKIIQQQKGRLGNLYETLNQYIHFGKNYFLDENNQRIFFQLAFQNLQSEHYQGDIELAEGALLIQLGIQELQNQINVNILTDILQQVIIYLQKLKKEGNKTLYSRVMGIILSSFYSVPQLTYEILKDLFTQIFNQIIETDYTPGYDIKLFIVTLCNLIQQQPKLLDVKLITTLINNLTKQQKHEKDQQDKQNMSFDQDDDDDENDDDDYNDDEEMNQAQQQIETFLSPIVKLDEYTLFNTTLQQLANGNPQLFDQIKQVIDPQIFNKLKEIILLIRIPTTDGQDLIRPIISAKKRKGQKN